MLFKRRTLSVHSVKSRRYLYVFITLVLLVSPLIGLLASRAVFVIFIAVVLISSFNIALNKTIALSLVLGVLISIFNLTIKEGALNYSKTLPEMHCKVD